MSLIIGPNGSGKTHVLDAIHLLAWGKSLYGNTKLDPNSRIEVLFWEAPLIRSYVFMEEAGKEFFAAQGKRATRPKYLQMLPFRTVYISPFDMNMLYFAPEMRRSYMDDILARTHEQFPRVKREYETTMRQRNALLRRIRDGLAQPQELDFWDAKLATQAALYGMYRMRYIQAVQEKIPTLPQFFWKYHVQMNYIGDWLHAEDPETYIRDTLMTTRDRDILSWHTHIGPHRDDFSLVMSSKEGQHSVQFFLSRGEMKMLLLGLKLIEADYLEWQTQTAVLLLVDDIFAELDDGNSRTFLNTITQHQIILTSQKPLPDAEKNQDFSCINLGLL